jgi:hypothetical protein
MEIEKLPDFLKPYAFFAVPTATAAKSLIFVLTTLIPRSSLALSSKTLDLYSSGLHYPEEQNTVST